MYIQYYYQFKLNLTVIYQHRKYFNASTTVLINEQLIKVMLIFNKLDGITARAATQYRVPKRFINKKSKTKKDLKLKKMYTPYEYTIHNEYIIICRI